MSMLGHAGSSTTGTSCSKGTILMQTRMVEAADGTSLSVAVCGDGQDVVLLSGGPGCVHYLAAEHLAPAGVRAWFPSPRGVAPSGGGPHTMTAAIADLEQLRRRLGIDRWTVLGHSWGSDLGVRYALDHPTSVRAMVGVAGHGLHRDRSWSQTYEAGRAKESEPVEIELVPEVYAVLWGSFNEWIHEPDLFRRIADSTVPMHFLAAGRDIRPDWPLRQLAELAPFGSFEEIPDVGHDLWATAPDIWQSVTSSACRRFAPRRT